MTARKGRAGTDAVVRTDADPGVGTDAVVRADADPGVGTGARAGRGAASPRPHLGDLTIRPLDAAAWDALAALFERPGDPRWCWCAYWRRPGTSWASHDVADNRSALRALADAPVAPGLVAFRGDVAVGWVAVAPRRDYVRLERSRTIPHLPGEGVWAITCFVVAKEVRRSGVAQLLLQAAVDFARVHGAREVEGYPVRTAGRRVPSALAYTGTLGMFERAGFAVAAETTSRPHPGATRVVVRLEA